MDGPSESVSSLLPGSLKVLTQKLARMDRLTVSSSYPQTQKIYQTKFFVYTPKHDKVNI